MAIHIGDFVAYYRLNKNETDIADQQKAVQDFLNGGNWKIIDEFVYLLSDKRLVELQEYVNKELISDFGRG